MPSSSSSYIHSLKLVLILTTIISIAITIKLTVPLLSTSLPVIWSVIITWLKPPYLYVVINAIIITIAATTRFQHNHHHHHDTQSQPPPSDLTLVSNNNNPSFGVMELPSVSYGGEPVVCETGPELETVPVPVRVNEDEIVNSGLGKKVEPEFGLPVKEKQPVTSRFANSRKPVKASLEGARALRVLKPKKHETLETTWKMITEGRQLPLTRHLKKSDTFNNLHDNQPTENPTTTTNTKVVKKAETFKDRTTTTTYANQNHYPSTNSSPTTTKLKKDGSLSQDELNRRVEAFIKKFNDDMRLQRQESLKQYMEMVNSGAR